MKRRLSTPSPPPVTRHPPTSLDNVTGVADISNTRSASHGIGDDLPSTNSTQAVGPNNPTSYVSSTSIEVPDIIQNLASVSSPNFQPNRCREPIVPRTSGNIPLSGTITDNPQQLINQSIYPIPSPQEKLASILNWINSLPSTSSKLRPTKPKSSPESENAEKVKVKIKIGPRATIVAELSKSTMPVATVVRAADAPILRTATIVADATITPTVPILNTATLLPVTPTASTPHPPNWKAHLQETELALLPFKLFPISSHSSEYTTLQEMLKPVHITSAEQIVNPTLWSRFVNTRKDMLLSKSDDLELLLKLGFDESVVMKSAHVSLNFEKDAAVKAYPYSDNLALLFHCTKNPQALDSILSQGLDDRLGRINGLLGRGIYFSDDPKKSICYDRCHGIIFVFAVLLGDCLSVNHMLSSKPNFVKEPEKTANQKRNYNDFNFDSIYACTIKRSEFEQSGYAEAKSECVVFNRYQCCPLY